MGKFKNLIVAVLICGLIVGYYLYLSNRTVDLQKAQEASTNANSEIAILMNRNLTGSYYPQYPRDVVNFYTRIVKAYYTKNLTEKEIDALGKQSLKLFDKELQIANPTEEFLSNLKLDIETYKELERSIYDVSVEDPEDIEIFTFQERQYANVTAVFKIREGGEIGAVYQDFMLRKDDEGYWRILYWVNSDPPLSEEDMTYSSEEAASLSSQ